MQFEFKKIKADLLAVGIFLVITFLYCFPLLQGKQFLGGDNIHWMGVAHEAMAYHDSTGKDVLWSNSIFGGMPTYTSYVGAKTTNYADFLQLFLQALGKPAYFFFIAMVCFYALMRVLKVNTWLAMIGAVAYSFASYNAIIISAGHDTKMMCIGYMPLAFAGLYMIFRQKWLSGAAIFGMSIALMMTNNHFQMMYYFGIIILCFGVVALFVAIKEGKLKEFFISVAVAAVVGGIALGPNVTSILTTKEYTNSTMRGGASELAGHDKKTSGGLDKEYAFRWSNGIAETFCIMVPYLYGGSSDEDAAKAPKTLEAAGGNAERLPTYWGDQPFLSGPVFFGAIICFLFLLGMLTIRSANKWWILAACTIAIVLSWGKNFAGVNYFLFDHVPMLNKFRTVEMALVIPQFLFPLLGIWTIQDILDKKIPTDQLIKNLKIAAGITAGLCVILGVGGSMFFSFTGPNDARYPAEIAKALKDDRASMAMSSALKSAALILLAAGVLWAFVTEKIKTIPFLAGLAILLVADLLPVSLDYLNSRGFSEKVDTNEFFQSQVAERHEKEAYDLIQRDKDPYFRVLDLGNNDPYNDAIQAYFFKCVGGYSPAKMEIYQDLIDRHLSGQHGFNGQVLNMLNTKYIITPGGQQRMPQVLPNPGTCGNAWFVDEVKWVNTAEEEITALNAAGIGDTTVKPGDFQPKKTAVVRNAFKNDMGSYTFGKDSAATVKLDKYGLDDISFKSNNSKDGLAVFSDIYYAAGWKAFVDGKETPIMRTDYVLRAIKVPAGAHNIEFHFRPDSFYTGQKIATATSIMLTLLCLFALIQAFRKPKAVA